MSKDGIKIHLNEKDLINFSGASNSEQSLQNSKGRLILLSVFLSVHILTVAEPVSACIPAIIQCMGEPISINPTLAATTFILGVKAEAECSSLSCTGHMANKSVI